MEIADGQPEAYFRGRKLRGREVKVPEGYRGVVVKECAKPQSENRATERMAVDDVDLEKSSGNVETTTLKEVGDFSEVVVWGHESTADSDDIFIKGVNEWVTFATAVSSDIPRSVGLV